MIQINKKSQCVGCGACAQRCPQKCILMKEDEEGFLYPHIDINLCINCSLCEKVCPVVNQNDPQLPINIFAAINPDEDVRLQSSSGGVFTVLAEKIIEQKGVVFGVKFNKRCEVVYGYTETKDGIAEFRGSKYVQSQIDQTFKEVELFLKNGRKVMFSGTPCQIAGLKLFLRKDYENLLCVDFICHGVPSPGVWKRYLNEKISVSSNAENINDVFIKQIEFRNKRDGWKNFGFCLSFSIPSENEEKKVFISESLYKNLFLKGFLSNLYLRPSCYECPTKKLKSGSDFTLGDYWGVDIERPDIDDDKGMGVLFINTNKGRKVAESLKLITFECDYNTIVKYNSALISSCNVPKNRSLFFNELDNNPILCLIEKYTSVSLLQRIRENLNFSVILKIYRLIISNNYNR